MQKHLDQLVKDYGKRNVYNKGEMLFRAEDLNFSLYFIESGIVGLEKGGNKFISIGGGEIIGEKSFVERSPKPVDAKILEDNTIIHILEQEAFDKFDHVNKQSLYGGLIMFLSQRVYKLNDILAFILEINNRILNYSVNYDKLILNDLFEKFIFLKGYAVFKHEDNELQKLYADISINNDIMTFLFSVMETGTDIKIGKNYIYIKSDEFVYLLFGDPKVEYYVISNTLLYAKSIFKYLGEKIELDRNKQFLKNM